MTKINNIIFCLEVISEPDKNDLFSARGVLPNFCIRWYEIIIIFHINFSFSLIIFLDSFNPSAQNKIRIIFKGPGAKNKILVDTGIIKLGANESLTKLPKQYQSIGMSLNFKNVSFEREGTYRAEVYVNDNLVGEKTIEVLKGLNNDE